MTSSVKIITDSACDISADIVAAESIGVVPLAIRFGEEEFIDGVDLSNDEFWSRLGTSAELPKTAAPSSDAFEQAFRKAKADGASGVVCVNLSSKLSATYQAAKKAAESVADEIEVHVIDSELCTVAQATLCLEAAKLSKTGLSAAEIVGRVEELRSKTRLYGTLDTMENLKRGGRVGGAKAFLGSLLALKPVIKFARGEVERESPQRTRKRALEYLARTVIEAAPVHNVSVAHSGAPDLNDFLAQLAPVADAERIPVSQVGSVIGTHGGPRLIAISYTEGPLPS